MAPEDRIGTPYIPMDLEKVVAVVESDYPDQTQPNAPEDDTSRAIANNLIEFLKHEVDKGRLPTNLLPIQSGIGNIANAVVGGLAHGNNFDKLKVWTEVLQDSTFSHVNLQLLYLICIYISRPKSQWCNDVVHCQSYQVLDSQNILSAVIWLFVPSPL